MIQIAVWWSEHIGTSILGILLQLVRSTEHKGFNTHRDNSKKEINFGQKSIKTSLKHPTNIINQPQNSVRLYHMTLYEVHKPSKVILLIA